MPHCEACLELAAKMDAWGPEGCEQRLDEIVEDILPRARSWMAENQLWAHRLLRIAVLEDTALRAAIRRYVRQAIERARNQPAPPRRKRNLRSGQKPIREAPEQRLPIADNSVRNKHRGIVTGARALHWPCLGALAIEAANQGLGLAVADHGLKPWQQKELSRVGVHWVVHDKPNIDIAKNRKAPSDPQAWWKPWVCAASPFDESVWVDSDAVVVGDLTDLFSVLPSITTQEQWCGNGSRLYSKLVRAVLPQHKSTLRVYENVNSGVVAWAKSDTSIIDDWRVMCQTILDNPKKVGKCTVRDQSGLVMSLIDRYRRNKMPPRMLPSKYNWPADGLRAKESGRRLAIPIIPEQLLEEAKRRHPTAVVVHWLGGIKPWKIAE